MTDDARRLARLNGRILRQFSARTVLALRAALPLRLALPHLEPVLEQNVDKEVEKDRTIILDIASGTETAIEDRVQRLLNTTREIDSRFLDKVGRFPVEIVVRYDEIIPFRTRRVRLLLSTAARILDASATQGGFRRGLATAYPQEELARIVNELFRLYAEEVRSLGRAVRLPGPLVPLREMVARELLEVMLRVAWPLAQEISAAATRLPVRTCARSTDD